MTEDEESWGREFVANATRGKSVEGCIVVHLGFEDTGKRWPGNSIKSILLLAIERGYHCFLLDMTGAIDEWQQYGVTTIRNLKTNQVISVISACNVLLCVDNAAFKTGVHFKKKVIPLFGFVPDCSITNKVMYSNGVFLNAGDIFSIIDNWVETPNTAHSKVLGDIETFEI